MIRLCRSDGPRVKDPAGSKQEGRDYDPGSLSPGA